MHALTCSRLLRDDDEAVRLILQDVSEAVVVESAAVVTDVKVKSLQAALTWLVQQHQATRDKLSSAAEEREALFFRVNTLEAQSTTATQCHLIFVSF